MRRRRSTSRTFGCQMNEYDSDKMSDVAKAAEATRQPTQTGRGRPDPLQHLLGARKSAREGLQRSRPRQAPEEEGRADRRRRLRGQPGRRGHHRARTYVDVVFGPQTLHRLPPMLGSASAGRPQVDISFPPRSKIRPPAAGAGRGSSALRLDHGRLQQVLLLLRRALHPRREFSRPVRDDADRNGGPGRPGRAEITLLGQNVNAYRGKMGDTRIADFAMLIEPSPRSPGVERIRYTTSHPRVHAAPDRRLRPRAAAGEPPAPAGAARQPTASCRR